MQESNKILQIIRKIIIQISLDYKKNEYNENKNIQNFMIKNHKIKLPTNKFTDTF